MSNSTEQPFHIIVGEQSDRGRSREHNEDSCDVFTTTVASAHDSSNIVQAQVAVVADGIGGAEGGKKASTIAINTIREAINARAFTSSVSKLLNHAIMRANDTINDERRRTPRFENMGTTVVVAIIAEDRLYVSHAGDSRAYLIRQNTIYRLTVDHTWVEEALAAGQLTAQKAATHPNKNVVKRYLGTNEPLIVDHQIIDITAPKGGNVIPSLKLQPGDVVMLCSDGLTDLATDQEILPVVKKHKNNPEKTANQLIDLANEKGGTDNITAVVMAWQDENKAAILAPLLQAPISLVIASLVIVLLLVGAAVSWSYSGGTVNESSPVAAESAPTTSPESIATGEETPTSNPAATATPMQTTNAGAGNSSNPATSTAVSTFTPISSDTPELEPSQTIPASGTNPQPTIDSPESNSEQPSASEPAAAEPSFTPEPPPSPTQDAAAAVPTTLVPTNTPTNASVVPTNTPTNVPIVPTNTPTNAPFVPTNTPTSVPVVPTNTPTNVPIVPTNTPTNVPIVPTNTPTNVPFVPTNTPTNVPFVPTNTPTNAPFVPTNTPTNAPFVPTNTPTSVPVVPTNTPTNVPIVPTNTPTNVPIVPTNTPVPPRNVTVTLLSPAPDDFQKTDTVRFRVQVSGKLDSDDLLLKTGVDQQVPFDEANLVWNSESSDIYFADMRYRPNNLGFGIKYYWTVVVIGADGQVYDSFEVRRFQWDDPNSGGGGPSSKGTPTGP